MSPAATIGEVLARAAGTPHGVTTIDHDLRERRLRYDQLARYASRGAYRLRHRGVAPGDRVCLVSQTSMDMVVGLFSVWAAGAVPIVMPLPRRRRELPDYLADLTARMATTTPSAVLVDDATLDPGLRFDDGVRVSVLGLSELDYETGGGLEWYDLVRQDDVGLIQFTSGTTRSSRAVTLTHGQIIANLTALRTALQVDPDADAIVSWLPLYHDMGIIGTLLGAVFFRTPLVLQPSRNFLARPASWLDAMSSHRGTITAAPNFGFALAARDLAAHPRPLDLRHVRCMYNGSEPVELATVDAFIAATEPYGLRPSAVTPTYGLAESTLAVTMGPLAARPACTWISQEALETEGRARPVGPGEPRKAVVPCGRPVPGASVAILDEAGSRVPDRQVGEICVRSPSVMRGYWGDAGATADALRDGWLHTGDLGFWDDDGGLVICGRAKDVIIIGGRNLYPDEYERHAETIPGIRHGSVTVFALPEHERMVVVAETTKAATDAGALAEAVLEKLRDHLTRAPREVVLIPPGALPKTSSGKRQRGLCRSKYRAGQLPVVARAGKPL
jgi:fatty-acyl-CoA synthase